MESNISLQPKTIEFLSKKVTTPQMAEAISGISRTHRTLRAREPRVYFLTGYSGTGKTFILEKYREMHAPKKPGQSNPIAHCTLDTAPTKKALFKTLLLELAGDIDGEALSRGTGADIFKRLSHVVKDRKVEMIMIDEAQHMMNSRIDARRSQVLADTFKSLVDVTGVPFVLCGQASIGGLLAKSKIPREDNQLIRRASGFTWLQPIELGDQWEDVVKQILCNVPLQTQNIFTRSNLARLYLATKGRIGLLTELFLWAIEYAHHRKRLTMEDLAEAYGMIAFSALNKCDPFGMDSRAAINKALAQEKNHDE